jgi:hypothetical protein
LLARFAKSHLQDVFGVIGEVAFALFQRDIPKPGTAVQRKDRSWESMSP